MSAATIGPSDARKRQVEQEDCDAAAGPDLRTEDARITDAMVERGGDFVARLGLLWKRGDPENQRRLKTAFPEYWAKYRTVAFF